MANEADHIAKFLGGPIYDRLKSYCSKLGETAVRGRTSSQLIEDAALRKRARRGGDGGIPRLRTESRKVSRLRQPIGDLVPRPGEIEAIGSIGWGRNADVGQWDIEFELLAAARTSGKRGCNLAEDALEEIDQDRVTATHREAFAILFRQRRGC